MNAVVTVETPNGYAAECFRKVIYPLTMLAALVTRQ